MGVQLSAASRHLFAKQEDCQSLVFMSAPLEKSPSKTDATRPLVDAEPDTLPYMATLLDRS